MKEERNSRGTSVTIPPRWIGELLAEIETTLEEYPELAEKIKRLVQNQLQALTPEQQQFIEIPKLIRLAENGKPKWEILEASRKYGVREVTPEEALKLILSQTSSSVLIVEDERARYWVYDGTNTAIRKLMHTLRGRT